MKVTVCLTQAEAIAVAAALRGHPISADLVASALAKIEDAYSAPPPSHIRLMIDGQIVDPSVPRGGSK